MRFGILSDIKFTKDNLNECLKELAKEFRKANGKHVRAEIILVGGASILVNYDFRQMTYDIDAVTYTNSAIKDVINRVGDRLGLPNGWLNADFTRTTSYTSKISQFSKYYKTFLNVLEVRTISSEYLIVMKLMSGRQYKNDLSDIIGILIEQKNMGDTITFDRIKYAAKEMYGDYDCLPKSSRDFIEEIFHTDDLQSLYEKTKIEESENKKILINFQEEYPSVLNGNNLEEILNTIKEKSKQL